MKNLKLFTLLIACCLFSVASIAQSFSNYGTYTGETAMGQTIEIELQANGVASMTIDNVSQGVTEYTVNGIYIKFKSLPTANTVGEALPVHQFRKGLIEPISATQWRLQLGDIGQPLPQQFDSNEIVLEFK
ncbi:MAG: hypothetical protein HKO56_01615 [Bacteroidia bacterium]|nr:hypothetical protein [Bacteroidia bacterium]NNM15327.1 hypothetical protein [Bacteroidia bacterium]